MDEQEISVSEHARMDVATDGERSSGPRILAVRYIELEVNDPDDTCRCHCISYCCCNCDRGGIIS